MLESIFNKVTGLLKKILNFLRTTVLKKIYERHFFCSIYQNDNKLLPKLLPMKKNICVNPNLASAPSLYPLFLNNLLSHQSFSNKNHCECYKKLASRSWPVLFTLPFFLLHTLFSSVAK